MSTPAASLGGVSVVSPVTTPSLRRSFAWTLAGNALYSICQWAMLSILARRGTPDTVGIFALGLAVCSPVFMLSNLQLRSVQATDTGTANDFASFFTLRCLCSLLAVTAIAILCGVVGYRGRTLAVILCIALAKALESLEDVITGLLQRHERLDLAARALSWRGLLSLLLFAAVFVRTRRVDLACASLIFSWGAVVLLYDVPLAGRVLTKQEGFWSRNAASMWGLIKVSGPLGMVMMLISLNANIPRYILERYLGPGELGIFASMAYVLTAVNLLVLALGHSASARMARMFASGCLKELRTLVLKLIAFGCLLGAGCFLCALIAGARFLMLVYGPAYASQGALLLWLSGTVGLSAVASFLGFAVTAARCFRPQIPVIALTTATTWLLSWILVPRLGLTGAAVALLISAGVQLAGFLALMQRAFHARRQIA